MSQDFSELLRKATSGLTLRVVAAALGLLVNYLLARYLGADGAGLYYMTLTVVVFLSTFSSLGLGNVMVRDIAAGSSSEGWYRAGLLGRASLLTLLCSLLLASVASLGAEWIAGLVYEEERIGVLIRVMAFAAIPLSLLNLVAGSLTGRRRISSSFLFQMVLVPLILCCAIPLLLPAYGIEVMPVLYFLAHVVALGGALLYWRSLRGEGLRDSGSPGLGEVLARGRRFYGIALLRTAAAWLPLFLLGIYANSTEVGLFTIAQRLALMTSFFLLAVSSIAAPQFAAIHRTGDHGEIGVLLLKATSLLVGASGLVAVIGTVFSEELMGLFGQEFLEARGWLIAMLWGQFFVTAFGLFESLLLMTGREHAVRNIYAIAVVLSLLVGTTFIEEHGGLGAVAAYMTCWLFSTTACICLVLSSSIDCRAALVRLMSR